MGSQNLAASGALILWHDYRSGHSFNQRGATGIGAVNGTLGRFRTGVGFETSHDFVGGAESSVGYIRVADSPFYFPPADGLCIVASYIQSSSRLECQIIGQGSAAAADTSWMLVRDAAGIYFITGDGVGTSIFSHAVAAVPGQIETVTVRYTGGVGVNNCTISVIAPVPSSSTGQIDRIPCNIAQPVSVGCYSGSADKPFMGTMRYVAFVRGAQTAAVLADLVAEMEAIQWPTATGLCDTSGSVATRALQYMSKFGVDCSIADEALSNSAPLSNSNWLVGSAVSGDDGLWQVAPVRMQHTASSGSPADVSKVLLARDNLGDRNTLRLRRELWSAGSDPTSAAYGTWDFWVYRDAANTTYTFVVTDTSAGEDDGYVVTLDVADAISLDLLQGGVFTSLITAAVVIPTDRYTHIRVTRTAGNVWKLYYDIGAGWVYAGTATDDTIIVSEGLFLSYGYLDALCLGNHRSEKALFKWRGVVNPK